MPAEPAPKPSPDQLSVVVFSAAFDKVHYALSMAAAALAINKPATLFFTMGAIRALLPATDGKGGWRDLLPTEAGLDAGKADAQLIARQLAGFEEMLAACVSLGARVMVCEMGLRATGLEGKALRGDVPITEGGLVTFLTDASSDGALVFV
jgi:peroxiredoxin family protein